VLLAVTLMAACGNQAEIQARAQRQLQARMDDVRAAVASADRAGAQSALRDLERSVSQLLGANQLTEGRATEILAAAQDVADQLSLLQEPEPSFSPSPLPTETPSELPTEKPEDPGKSEDKGKDKGKGKAKGKG
jgi:outer membrane biosynthesis protein TonB